MQKYKKIMLFMLIAAIASAGISACRRGAAHEAEESMVHFEEEFL